MKMFPAETDFIDIHSHSLANEEGVFRLHNVFSADFPHIPIDLPLSIGLHPWHLNADAINELPGILRNAVELPNIFALGETGLDSVSKTPIDEQLPVFRKHIEFGIEYKKPLIIHCVKAFQELLGLRREYPESAVWIVHGFNSNETIAAGCVKAGIYVSLSQRLLRNPEKAAKITSVVPLSSVFIETDDDPMSIQAVYEAVSGFYGVELKELKRNIFDNYFRVFR